MGIRLLGPISLVTADLNHDNIPDIVIADYDGRSIQVAFGRADGTFTAPSTPIILGPVRQVTIADFDGDGIVDIAAIASSTAGGELFVIKGKGDAVFEQPLRFQLPQSGMAILAADVNGDGAVDLVIGQMDGVLVRFGNADGTFQEGEIIPLDVVPVTIRHRDLNGDGIPDLAIAGTGRPDSPFTSELARIHILLGTTGGSLQPVAPLAMGRGRPFDFAIGDFNSDGTPDVAIADSYNAMYWIAAGRGDGTFGNLTGIEMQDAPLSIASADLNEDGIPDLAIGNYYGGRITILFGKGDGTFEKKSDVVAKGDNFAVVIADMNGDALPDLVAANRSSRSVTVALGVGGGEFEPPQHLSSSPLWLAVANKDPEGKTGLAAINIVSDSVVVLSPALQVARVFRVGRDPTRLVSADFNGDRLPDLAVLNLGSRDISVLLGTEDGGFQPAESTPLGAAPIAMAEGDWNGDGRSDLVISLAGEDRGLLLLSKSNGEFESGPDVTGLGGASFLTVADLNGDGIPDLGVASASSIGSIRVLFGRAGARFQAGPVFALEGLATTIVAADVNGDGRPDIISNLGASGVVLLARGDGTFEAPKVIPGPAPGMGTYSAMATADFDGDGRMDLATVSPQGVRFFPGNGDGTFRVAGASFLNARPVFLLALPADASGRSDLAAADLARGMVSIYTYPR